MFLKRPSLLVLLCALLSSCAASYKPIQPDKLRFDNPTVSSDSISYATKSSVLAATGNKRYAKKEAKKGVRVMALQVTNHSQRDILLRNDARFFMGERNVFPLEPTQLSAQIKQPAGLYMLWSLLWLFYTQCENDDCTSVPIPLGLIIGIGNTAAASNANKKLLQELERNNILDKVIKPGETVTGLIGFGLTDDRGLRIELAK